MDSSDVSEDGLGDDNDKEVIIIPIKNGLHQQKKVIA